MTAPGDQLLYSRSGFDLIQLCRDNPELAIRLSEERPLLSHVIGADAGPDLVAVALDAERRSLIKVDAVRIADLIPEAGQIKMIVLSSGSGLMLG